MGLIAAIRRALVLTAEFGHVGSSAEPIAKFFIMELAVLTLLILALAVSLFVLRKREATQHSTPQTSAPRSDPG